LTKKLFLKDIKADRRIFGQKNKNKSEKIISALTAYITYVRG
jgi:hypothetical protein